MIGATKGADHAGVNPDEPDDFEGENTIEGDAAVATSTGLSAGERGASRPFS